MNKVMVLVLAVLCKLCSTKYFVPNPLAIFVFYLIGFDWIHVRLSLFVESVSHSTINQ
jgi:hypothetical protein